MTARFERAPILLVLLAATLLVAWPGSARAQESGLSKSQLVRLVMSGATADQKLATVRSECLSFEPTERDWRDLRGLGADEALIAAAQECARLAEAVRVSVSASRITARAGDTTGVTVTLSQAGSPLTGGTTGPG